MLNSPILSEMFEFLLKQYHITMMQTDMDVFDENSKMETTINVVFNNGVPKIHLSIVTQLMHLDIHILHRKSAEIDVFDYVVGELVYNYHNYFDNLEDLKQVIIKAFSYIKI